MLDLQGCVRQPVSYTHLDVYKRQGIGSTLMQELIFFAKNHKLIRNISLGVRASNHTAISLYEKFGFVKTGVHKNYFCINGEYDDEYIIDLYLEK